MKDEDGRVEIGKREPLYEGFYRLERFTVRHQRFDGRWSDDLCREVLIQSPAVGILPYDPQMDAIVLTEQFRLPAKLAGFPAWQLEIPAGMVEEGEEAREVARREVREETGLDILGDPVLIHKFLTSPGCTTETVHLYCARIDAGAAGGLHGREEENEDIRVVVKAYAEIMQLVRDSRIANGFTLFSFWWLVANRDRLRELWRPSVNRS